MAKSVILESYSSPDVPGYADKVAVFDEQKIAYHCLCSVAPNPSRPWPRQSIKWQDCYGWLAPGELAWRCIRHWKYGKCLLINEGLECATRNPNVNHDGRYVATEIILHKGWSAVWRGSAACPTIPPEKWKGFIACFEIDESGKLMIADFRKPIPVLCRRGSVCPMRI